MKAPGRSGAAMRVVSLGAWLLLAVAQQACSPIPPPDVLAQIDRVRSSPAAVQAHRDAPTAYAQAERLRQRARRVLEEDDFAGARILGEQALAAYQRSVALGRVARADAERVVLEERVGRAERQVAELDRVHQRIGADIAAVEARLRVLKNLEPTRPSDGARPRRERARAQAVRTLQLQASLLCAAARLLGASHRGDPGFSEPAAVGGAAEALAELEQRLAKGSTAAPIDRARRVRAGCLAALTEVRRAVSASPAANGPDALLDQLSAAGEGSVRRDDRGVAVTLWGVFAGDRLSASGERAAKALSVVARQHPAVPLMVVLHQRRPVDQRARARQVARLVALTARFERELGGQPLVSGSLAGAGAPLVDPGGVHAARNERVEIVFVTAGGG